MSPADCHRPFHPRSPICAECPSLGDCVDFEQPLAFVPEPPRTDAPLKVIPPRCHSHRPHTYPGRRSNFRGVVMA